MVAARKQLKESLAAREEELAVARDLIGYLDRLINPAVGEAMEGARLYAQAQAYRRRNRRAIQEAAPPTQEQRDQVMRDRGYIRRTGAKPVEHNEPTREEIETAAKVCEQLGHRVTALALRHRLERESDG